jgi:glycosyltransferase involved in cell wall biosynthesis
LISKDDIIICDGFWGNGLEDWTKNLVIHRHGIYSHCTKIDIDNGKKPEFPQQHEFQIKFTEKHLKNGGRVTTVSDFIAHEMKEQWGWNNIQVINNGVDLNIWKPRGKIWKRPLQNLIIHGVNDKNNFNKGWLHIEALKKDLPDFNILSLY